MVPADRAWRAVEMRNFAMFLDWNHKKPLNGWRAPSTVIRWKRPSKEIFPHPGMSSDFCCSGPWLDSEQDGEQRSSVAWFLMIQFLRIQYQPLHSGHGKINKLCYCWFSFLEVPLPQLLIKFLGKPIFPCKGSQLLCTSFTTPWSIGIYFTLDLSLVCLYFRDTVLLSEICRHMSQNWVPITIFRFSEKCDLTQRSVKKLSVAMERRGAQHLWNIICLEESKYRF